MAVQRSSRGVVTVNNTTGTTFNIEETVAGVVSGRGAVTLKVRNENAGGGNRLRVEINGVVGDPATEFDSLAPQQTEYYRSPNGRIKTVTLKGVGGNSDATFAVVEGDEVFPPVNPR